MIDQSPTRVRSLYMICQQPNQLQFIAKNRTDWQHAACIVQVVTIIVCQLSSNILTALYKKFMCAIDKVLSLLVINS